MEKLIGIIHFQHQIFCRGDCLGRTYASTIGGERAQIVLPSLRVVPLPVKPDWSNIIVEKPGLLQSTRHDDWGFVYGHNATRAEDTTCMCVGIKRVVVIFESNTSQKKDSVANIAADLNPWRSQLYERILLTGKTINLNRQTDYFERQGKATGFELYQQDDYSSLELNSEYCVEAIFHRTENCLQPNELQSILLDIDTQKALTNEYEMYLRAVLEYKQNRFRSAIMEATTAVELSVIQKIKERCNELGIDGHGLCEMYYRSLGDRFSLLTQLKISLPTADPQKEIVKPRNNLFHNRTLTPTAQECSDVLNSVKKYLMTFQPNMYE